MQALEMKPTVVAGGFLEGCCDFDEFSSKDCYLATDERGSE